MSNYGKNISISIFGESHGSTVGILISGLKPGLSFDLSYIRAQLDRRKPGTSKFSSPRKETDEYVIKSGVYKNRTTGEPLLVMFDNVDVKSEDYDNSIIRPSHVDYPALIKSNGFVDLRGSGRFSGRLTTGLVFTAALIECNELLGSIKVCSHVSKVQDICDDDIDVVDVQRLKSVAMPVVNSGVKSKIEERILTAKSSGDSLGAQIKVCAFNVPVGISGGYFESLESKISQLLFSVPAVKGVSFGLGFEYSDYLGSEVSDEYSYVNDELVITSNNNGGIIGGMSNGNTIVCNVVIKPTASILKQQNTVNYVTKKNVKYQIRGRHDPAIFSRIGVILESCVVIALYDLLQEIT